MILLILPDGGIDRVSRSSISRFPWHIRQQLHKVWRSLPQVHLAQFIYPHISCNMKVIGTSGNDRKEGQVEAVFCIGKKERLHDSHKSEQKKGDRWGLNPQPLEPQSSALPIELRSPRHALNVSLV